MIYIKCPNYMPNIMILTQKVLQIFCSQCCFTTQNAKVGKGGSLSQIFTEFCQKANQIIYTLDTICEPKIMILAQAVLGLFCSQGSIGLQWESRKNIDKAP